RRGRARAEWIASPLVPRAPGVRRADPGFSAGRLRSPSASLGRRKTAPSGRSHRKVVTIGKDGSPAWEPGGRTLWGASCGSIYEVSLGAQKAFPSRYPAPTGHDHVDPDVSPDGHAIAFSRSGRMRRWNLEP